MENRKEVAWFDTLDGVELFTVDVEDIYTVTAEPEQLLNCCVIDGMTVQGCEEVLVWSACVAAGVRSSMVHNIEQAQTGMQRIARSCFDGSAKYASPIEKAWMWYVINFTRRNGTGKALFQLYPFLWAIVFAARFESVRFEISQELGRYEPRFSEQGGMCDVLGPPGYADYRYAVEEHRKSRALQTNAEVRAHALWNDLRQAAGKATSPGQLIRVLQRMSSVRLEGMPRYARQMLSRISAGNFTTY